MRKLMSNRLLWRGGAGWLSTGRRAFLAGAVFSLFLLGPWVAGVCGCTMFELGAFTLVLAAALTGGNTVYGAITGEREKNTLDGLRLTQLTPGQLVAGKLLGELLALGRLLLATAPALVVLATLGSVGWKPLLLTWLVAGLAGLFASVSAIFVSSLSATTSQAVMAGWILKGVWLVGTPILDLVARAVLVQRDPVPILTALNPLAAAGLATVPEAALGAWAWMVPEYTVSMLLALAGMGWVAARRLSDDLASGSGLDDPQVHAAWRSDWGPSWLKRLAPGLSRNATFLREVAFQNRTGGAGWPGYLVFGVLFLAPFLYARAWALSDEARGAMTPAAQPRVEITSHVPTDLGSVVLPPRAPLSRDTFIRVPGQRTTLVFHGHEAGTCFRLALYRAAGVPMPRGAMSVLVVPDEATLSFKPLGGGPEILQVEQVDDSVLRPFGMTDPGPAPAALVNSAERQEAALRRALHVGLTGTLVLFLLYLSIRCTGFLAGSLTGEKDRRSWQDLALTGVPASQVLKGKLWGSLVFTLLQMTVIFPVLSLYAFSASLAVPELVGLYFYSAALAVTAGIVGLWASAGAKTTHQAHGRALGLVLAAFVLVPLTGSLLTPVLIAGALFATVLGLVRGSGAWAGWAAVAAGLFLAPYALSPLTAAVGFMPSLHDGGAGFLAALNVAPVDSCQGLAGFVGALMVLGGLSFALWTGALHRVTDQMEGSALQAE